MFYLHICYRPQRKVMFYAYLSVHLRKLRKMGPLHSRAEHVAHFLRLTSNATPADLLASSMAVNPISSTYLQPGIVGAWTLYQLSYAGVVIWTNPPIFRVPWTIFIVVSGTPFL